ncbi:hypothetical protein L198_02806 [Cryptococcus wingfieldii CBS 7118]|uniref:C2H2-type domain-containing protein n=1 Tax=Cryptococcus wingfieldii CBS 7118 TaxID=1295528 RepID=A0A1E3JMI5_9TREE|nr:hypothetical protein L198_02806 [Cryptococcus wingfieldii CBS 7118]ODO02075.1 hypothetical protein L198_02806 [Cryptococcus wingfieldii CBS 7118]
MSFIVSALDAALLAAILASTFISPPPSNPCACDCTCGRKYRLPAQYASDAKPAGNEQAYHSGREEVAVTGEEEAEQQVVADAAVAISPLQPSLLEADSDPVPMRSSIPQPASPEIYAQPTISPKEPAKLPTPVSSVDQTEFEDDGSNLKVGMTTPTTSPGQQSNRRANDDNMGNERYTTLAKPRNTRENPKLDKLQSVYQGRPVPPHQVRSSEDTTDPKYDYRFSLCDTLGATSLKINKSEFVCKPCNKHFKTLIALQMHHTAVHSLSAKPVQRRMSNTPGIQTRVTQTPPIVAPPATEKAVSLDDGFEPQNMCDVCQADFVNITTLRQHKQEKHSWAVLCPECLMFFNQAQEATDHYQLIHGIAPTSLLKTQRMLDTLKKPAPTPDPVHFPPLAPVPPKKREYQILASYDSHILRKEHHCSQCEMVFSDASELDEHANNPYSHGGVKLTPDNLPPLGSDRAHIEPLSNSNLNSDLNAQPKPSSTYPAYPRSAWDSSMPAFSLASRLANSPQSVHGVVAEAKLTTEEDEEVSGESVSVAMPKQSSIGEKPLEHDVLEEAPKIHQVEAEVEQVNIQAEAVEEGEVQKEQSGEQAKAVSGPGSERDTPPFQSQEPFRHESEGFDEDFGTIDSSVTGALSSVDGSSSVASRNLLPTAPIHPKPLDTPTSMSVTSSHSQEEPAVHFFSKAAKRRLLKNPQLSKAEKKALAREVYRGAPQPKKLKQPKAQKLDAFFSSDEDLNEELPSDCEMLVGDVADYGVQVQILKEKEQQQASRQVEAATAAPEIKAPYGRGALTMSLYAEARSNLPARRYEVDSDDENDESAVQGDKSSPDAVEETFVVEPPAPSDLEPIRDEEEVIEIRRAPYKSHSPYDDWSDEEKEPAIDPDALSEPVEKVDLPPTQLVEARTESAIVIPSDIQEPATTPVHTLPEGVQLLFGDKVREPEDYPLPPSPVWEASAYDGPIKDFDAIRAPIRAGQASVSEQDASAVSLAISEGPSDNSSQTGTALEDVGGGDVDAVAAASAILEIRESPVESHKTEEIPRDFDREGTPGLSSSLITPNTPLASNSSRNHSEDEHTFQREVGGHSSEDDRSGDRYILNFAPPELETAWAPARSTENSWADFDQDEAELARRLAELEAEQAAVAAKEFDNGLPDLDQAAMIGNIEFQVPSFDFPESDTMTASDTPPQELSANEVENKEVIVAPTEPTLSPSIPATTGRGVWDAAHEVTRIAIAAKAAAPPLELGPDRHHSNEYAGQWTNNAPRYQNQARRDGPNRHHSTRGQGSNVYYSRGSGRQPEAARGNSQGVSALAKMRSTRPEVLALRYELEDGREAEQAKRANTTSVRSSSFYATDDSGWFSLDSLGENVYGMDSGWSLDRRESVGRGGSGISRSVNPSTGSDGRPSSPMGTNEWGALLEVQGNTWGW